MYVHTHLLDFLIPPENLKDDLDIHIIFTKMSILLRKFLNHVCELDHYKVEGSSVIIFSSEFGTLTTVRVFHHGIITVSIEYSVGPNDPVVDLKTCQEIEKGVLETIPGISRSQVLCPIKRGEVRYLRSSDNRLLEYDIDKVVFEENSPYQKVQIVHSKTLGNMLVLDDLQNLSESDSIYTDTLMQKGKENYRDKDIIILGGGDGALLHELLKERPHFVIMLEIDEVVMKACNEHMKSVCGNVLERKKGPNFRIITGDCVEQLQTIISEGKKFDYVFGDLTDIPISSSATGHHWDFIREILSMSFQILKPTGQFLTHGNGVSCKEALKMYEAQLKKLDPPVSYTKKVVNVPSFLEDWVFYQVKFKNQPIMQKV